LPHKKGRQTLFKEIGETKRTTIFYESPHRILKTLESLAEYAGEKKVIIARELTKMYEEVLEGTAIELLNVLTEIPEKKKGEFVVIVSR
jgi:16S rRNA (cytidine1402-2'-O)-methyltransferase